MVWAPAVEVREKQGWWAGSQSSRSWEDERKLEKSR